MSSTGLKIPESVRGGCISIGNFDGVHRGHCRMLSALRELARQQQTHSVAVTFHPHPMALLRPESAPPLLTGIHERSRLLREFGVDSVAVLPVDAALLAVSPAEFFDSFIVGELQARGIVEGPNFRFGCDRRGDIQSLAAMCSMHSIPLRVVELVADGPAEISSSRIRRLLQKGDVTAAVQLLGRPYRLQGIVRSGAGRGGQLGFPTANLTDIETLLPNPGVYAGCADLPDRKYVAAVSIGPNLTFGEKATKVECFLDGYSGNLYQKQLNVDLIAQVRPLQTFADSESLVRQIREDVTSCRRQLEGHMAVR